MKKTLAIILALALVFSSFTVAFAEETLPADAKAVAGLGMLVGAGNGVTLDYLKTAPTRIQAAIMLLRLKGEDKAALAFTGTDNFADAKDAQWAAPIMAYLKANPRLGFVGDGVNFEPNKEITVQQYYKVMLETLGYKANTAEVIGDFTYAGTVDFAAKQGLSKVASVLSFTVNDLATATMETLKATVKGGTKTLGYTLVETKVLTEAAAVAAGIYKIVPAALAVESVTATNLQQLVVKFNKAVDKDTVIVANFTIGGVNAGAVKLAVDNMTVTVTVATPATVQPANYDLVVNNVKDTAGVAIAKYTTTLRVFDNAIPTITGMKLVGPNKIELTFSEPIKTEGSVKINNGIYGVVVPVADGTNVSTITLSASTLPAGTYEVKATGFKDYAGFAIDSTTLQLVYAKDLTAPVATIKEATQTSVVVVFNKPLIIDATYADAIAEDVDGVVGNDPDSYEDYFYQTFSGWMPNSVVKSADSKTFTLTFNTYPIPAGTANLVVKAKGSAGVALTDEWGNKVESNLVLAVTVAADNTAPAVKETKVVDEQNIDIYFTEAIDTTKAQDETNYTVKDADGKAVTTTFTATYTAATKKVNLDFDANLTGGNYTVEVKGMVDKSLTENAMPTTTLAFVITDKTPINPGVNATDVVITAVESTSANVADIIYVTYGEKMAVTGQYSVLAANNYLLAGAALPENTTLEMFGATGKVVKISVPENAAFNLQTVDTATLTIARVADLAGNTMVALSYPEVIGTEVAPIVTAVKQTDYNKATITINKPLKVVLASGFTVGTGAAAKEVAAIDTWSVNDKNQTIVLVTLNANNTTSQTNTADIITEVDVVANILVSETGVKMAAADYSGVIADGRAPRLIADDTTTVGFHEAVVDMAGAPNNNMFEIKFTEALDATAASAALMAQDLVIVKVAADGTETALVAGVDFTTAVSGSSLVVTASAGDFKVKSKDAITYIKDNAAGTKNKASVFTTAIKVTVVNQ